MKPSSAECSALTRGFPTHTILANKVHELELDDLNSCIRAFIRTGEKAIIGHQNLHSLYLCLHDDMMREFYERCTLVHVAGMALILISKLLGLPLSRRNRVTYVDWIHPLVSMIEEEGWRLFYLGSEPGVADKGLDALRATYPSLAAESHHGYFDAHSESEENRHVLDRIASYDPDVLFVGMGMPRQERWVVENQDRLTARVTLTSGACIDYVADVIRTPPRWMGNIGIEWLYRLATEPRRLGDRYLIEPWHLLPHLAREWKDRRATAIPGANR